MFDTDSSAFSTIERTAAGAYDDVNGTWLRVICFPHHVMLVMAPVSCCNSLAS